MEHGRIFQRELHITEASRTAQGQAYMAHCALRRWQLCPLHAEPGTGVLSRLPNRGPVLRSVTHLGCPQSCLFHSWGRVGGSSSLPQPAPCQGVCLSLPLQTASPQADLWDPGLPKAWAQVTAWCCPLERESSEHRSLTAWLLGDGMWGGIFLCTSNASAFQFLLSQTPWPLSFPEKEKTSNGGLSTGHR